METFERTWEVPLGYEGTSWSVSVLVNSWRVYSILSGTLSIRTPKERIAKATTSDSNMARSAADWVLDYTMNSIIAGVTIHLTNSPDLVVALMVIEISMSIHRSKGKLTLSGMKISLPYG